MPFQIWITPAGYNITVYGKISATSADTATIQYSTVSSTGPWTSVGSSFNSTSCTSRGTITGINSGTTVYFQVINSALDPINYGAATSTTCPGGGTGCVHSIVVTADTDQAFTATVSGGSFTLC